jgi:hypothetical protein
LMLGILDADAWHWGCGWLLGTVAGCLALWLFDDWDCWHRLWMLMLGTVDAVAWHC